MNNQYSHNNSSLALHGHNLVSGNNNSNYQSAVPEKDMQSVRSVTNSQIDLHHRAQY